MSGNQTLMYVGVGIGAMFLILMGGAHHIIVAVLALGAVYGGYVLSEGGKGDTTFLLGGLLVAAGLFIAFVLKGHDEGEGEGGMDAYGMGGLGLPMGY